jgi:hypothetical protein
MDLAPNGVCHPAVRHGVIGSLALVAGPTDRRFSLICSGHRRSLDPNEFALARPLQTLTPAPLGPRRERRSVMRFAGGNARGSNRCGTVA